MPLSDTCLAVAGGSRDNGAQLEMAACKPPGPPPAGATYTGNWDQNWYYNEREEPNDTSDDPHDGELGVYGGSKCLAPLNDPSNPTNPLVQIVDCTGAPDQKWTPRSDGLIANDQNQTCLERSGTTVRLNTCGATGPNQPWAWPVAAAQHTAAMTMSCVPEEVASMGTTTCTAKVTDPADTPRTPTGTVTFSSSGYGTFDASSCTLSGSGSSASCQVRYTPPSSTRSFQWRVNASYSGDNSHPPLSVSTTVTTVGEW